MADVHCVVLNSFDFESPYFHCYNSNCSHLGIPGRGWLEGSSGRLLCHCSGRTGHAPYLHQLALCTESVREHHSCEYGMMMHLPAILSVPCTNSKFLLLIFFGQGTQVIQVAGIDQDRGIPNALSYSFIKGRV